MAGLYNDDYEVRSDPGRNFLLIFGSPLLAAKSGYHDEFFSSFATLYAHLKLQRFTCSNRKTNYFKMIRKVQKKAMDKISNEEMFL